MKRAFEQLDDLDCDTDRVGGKEMHVYMREVLKYPILSREEEQAIARRFVETQDPELRNKLVRANLRFVIRIASSYRYSGLSFLDLIQEGNLGLMKAVDKFEPARGFKLISYASWWIKAYIHRFMQHNHCLIKIPSGTRARMMMALLNRPEINAALDEIQAGRDVDMTEMLTDADIEEGITPSMLLTARERSKPEISLDQPAFDDKGNPMTLGDNLHEGIDHQRARAIAVDTEGIMRAIEQLRARLSAKEQIVLDHRILLEDMTLQEVADMPEFQVSRERIRQIEARIMERIKIALNFNGYRDYVASLNS